MNGFELLANFRVTRSEESFGEFVRRYTNFVYSTAKRRNEAQAQEATQLVFIRLANAAPDLRGEAELLAWLHRTTVHVSIDLWRAESRRRAREDQAAAMQNLAENPTWQQLSPTLDESLNALTDSDRQTILLRFFDQKSMREVGSILGISEDAAKMRVSRALDRLRNQLGIEGAACTAVALGTMLGERSVEAAPTPVVAALAAFSFPIPIVGGTAASAVAVLTQATKIKLMAGAAAMGVAGLALLLVLHSRSMTSMVTPSTAPAAQVETETAAAVTPPTTPDTAASAPLTADTEPDPLQLLQAVARIRESLTSGSLEMQVSSTSFTGRDEVKSAEQLNVLFEGTKRRFDSVGREYSYLQASEEVDERIRELGGDREAAVQEALLEGFEAHVVTIYDESVFMNYREKDGRPERTAIGDPSEGSGEFNFDPRSLGLTTSTYIKGTIASSLAYTNAKSVKLIGKENVDGQSAWHVQVLSQYDQSLDFWIDAQNPVRVLKHANGRNVAISKFNDPSSVLPTEVQISEHRGGQPFFLQRFVLTAGQFKFPVDPNTWTLAGLGMAVGTSVSDARNHRHLGYWNGTGLADSPPRSDLPAGTPLDLARLLSLLDNSPRSIEALEAACWIILNTPDGPAVAKAADVVLREHINNPSLEKFCQDLERVRPRCAKPLLEEMLEHNQSTEVRARACFTLATILKNEADYGRNAKATEAAIKLFQRLTREFGSVAGNGSDLVQQAAPELHELQHLKIGQPAPPTEGVDLEGHPLKLSDYRGKIVVLHFWSSSYDELEEHRKLVESMRGKPFALLGVDGTSNLEQAKTIVATNNITWPSFRDGRDGPIYAAWNVNSWPTIFVLDRQGIIRFRDYRDTRGGALAKTVETLLGN